MVMTKEIHSVMTKDSTMAKSLVIPMVMTKEIHLVTMKVTKMVMHLGFHLVIRLGSTMAKSLVNQKEKSLVMMMVSTKEIHLVTMKVTSLEIHSVMTKDSTMAKSLVIPMVMTK